MDRLQIPIKWKRSISYTGHDKGKKVNSRRTVSLSSEEESKSSRSRSPGNSPSGKKRSLLYTATKKMSRPRSKSPFHSRRHFRRQSEELTPNEDEFIKDNSASFGRNSWYYGEIGIICNENSSVIEEEETSTPSQKDVNENLEISTGVDENGNNVFSTDNTTDIDIDGKRKTLIENSNDIRILDNHPIDNSQSEKTYVNGSIIARIDEANNVSCNVLFNFCKEKYAEAIPFMDGMYCLDFSDEDQPRFTSIPNLIAYLIENNFMERVTFSYLCELTSSSAEV